MLCQEIFELDPKAPINDIRMKKIIIHALKPEYKSFVFTIQIWQNQSSLVEFKNCLADKKELVKQMGGVLLKNEEKTLYMLAEVKGALVKGEARTITTTTKSLKESVIIVGKRTT